MPGGVVAVEEGIPEEAMRRLVEMGHPVIPTRGMERSVFGRGQVITRDAQSGVLWGGSDPRADGCAMTL
jgi:gamma-glutamyltranspeptidase/glutathione hydrolase